MTFYIRQERMMKMLIQANHALLEQAATLIKGLNEADYALSMPAYGSGSIGQHVRHVLDHYQALFTRQHGLIDYDQRRRDNAVETNKTLALSEIQRVLHSLPTLVDQAVRVRSEISPHAQQMEEVGSTLKRELLFVTSHAVHHFALIAMLLRLQGMVVPADFGVAPATLTHQRQQTQAA
jgi:uncharacterized damage-inducible protein DinB